MVLSQVWMHVNGKRLSVSGTVLLFVDAKGGCLMSFMHAKLTLFVPALPSTEPSTDSENGDGASIDGGTADIDAGIADTLAAAAAPDTPVAHMAVD